MTDERVYQLWLATIPGVTPQRYRLLMNEYGCAKYVWEQQIIVKRMLPEKVWLNIKESANAEYLDALLASMEEGGIRAVFAEDDEYPARLMQVPDMPPVLFVRGAMRLNEPRSVALVGTRRPSRDGRAVAARFAGELVEHGVSVVSGLAMGIDAAAHQGALDEGGHTIAVLAGSVDIASPAENAALYERILAEGGTVVSQYRPGTAARPAFFAARNAIVCALADAAVVVECGEKSGSLITAQHARKQGKGLFAVPGPVWMPGFRGSNSLLVDGVRAAVSGLDIVNFYDWHDKRPEKIIKPRELSALPEGAEALVERLRIDELSFDELMAEGAASASQLNSLLTILELRGIIKQSAGRLYRAID